MNLHTNILHRGMQSLPQHCSGYIVGFPCQPWSLLNAKSRTWDDPRAQVFHACISSCIQMLPQWCIFENVLGLLRFQTRLQQTFKQAGMGRHYIIVLVPLCPHKILKEPIRRERVYILCIRRDVALTQDVGILRDFVASLVQAAHHNSPTSLEQVLGPGYGIKCTNLTQRQLAICKDARQKLLQGKADSVVIDVSQSRERVPCGFGVVPCLTTGCQPVLVSRSGAVKAISTSEKFALHGFNLQRFKLPQMPETKLKKLIGNSMHVGCVQLALLLTFSMINWNHPGSRPGRKPQMHSVSAVSEARNKLVSWKSVACILQHHAKTPATQHTSCPSNITGKGKCAEPKGPRQCVAPKSKRTRVPLPEPLQKKRRLGDLLSGK